MRRQRFACRLVAIGVVGTGSAHAYTTAAPPLPPPVLITTRHGTAAPGRRLLGKSATTTCLYSGEDNPEKRKGGGVFDFIFNPYESNIPEEIREDIYAAEANTQAAKDRGQRVALYAAFAFTGILCAFFNGFLTELRSGTDGVPVDLNDAGFGWVSSNFLLEFLFTNKVGGGICLLGGAGAGLLAEAEYDTRRINAEKIFGEMQRRRIEKEGTAVDGGKKTKLEKVKKRRSGKEAKRIGAITEVVSEDTQNLVGTNEFQDTEAKEELESSLEKNENAILGAIKGFYEKADTMAASQALLLNKKLEDEGLIEKITDKTGFRVIGRDEAAKLQKKDDFEKEKIP